MLVWRSVPFWVCWYVQTLFPYRNDLDDAVVVGLTKTQLERITEMYAERMFTVMQSNVNIAEPCTPITMTASLKSYGYQTFEFMHQDV